MTTSSQSLFSVLGGAPRTVPARRRVGPVFLGLVVWVAGLFMFGQLPAAAHMVLVEHIRCSEHGEWVHEGEGHGGSRPRGLEADVAAAQGRPADRGHGHEHCRFVAQRREAAVASGSVDRAPMGPPPFAGEATASLFAPHGEQVYAYAPKTSPPA